MRKKDPEPVGSSDPSANVWASPEMSALDKLLRQTLQVPKVEIDRIRAKEREARNGNEKK